MKAEEGCQLKEEHFVVLYDCGSLFCHTSCANLVLNIHIVLSCWSISLFLHHCFLINGGGYSC